MTYSFGKAATEAEELALQAQQAATLKAPTEAEQIARDAVIANATVEASLPPAVIARMAADRAAAAQTAVTRAAGGMSTGTKVAIGVGAAVAVAGIAYVTLRPKTSTPTLMVKNHRRKSSRGLRSNPPVSLATFKSVVYPVKGKLFVLREDIHLLRDANDDITLEDGREYDSADCLGGKAYQILQRGTPEHAAFVAEWEERERLRSNSSSDCRGDANYPCGECARCRAIWSGSYDDMMRKREQRPLGHAEFCECVECKNLRRNGPAVPYDDQKHAVAVTKGVLREVFGDTIDHISDEEMDDAVVPASDDRGQWSPRAAAIIYVENGFPGDYTEYGMELWQQVGAELEDAGLYFEPVNSAVFAVYPI